MHIHNYSVHLYTVYELNDSQWVVPEEVYLWLPGNTHSRIGWVDRTNPDYDTDSYINYMYYVHCVYSAYNTALVHVTVRCASEICNCHYRTSHVSLRTCRVSWTTSVLYHM